MLITFEDVLKWVEKIVHKEHPSYAIKLISTSSYWKISLMDTYFDYCIMRINNRRDGGYWFSLNSYPEMDKNDPRFDRVENKNKNHWVINIKKLDDILEYEDFILPIVNYLAETYEIEKYPFDENQQSVFSANGSGISLHLNFK